MDQPYMEFKRLTLKEQQEYRAAAQRDYVAFTDIQGVWHPVYQDECVRINFNAATFVSPQPIN